MTEERKLTYRVVVQTTPELAFEAVTAGSELREWLSDEARTDVRLGGRFEVRWSSGYRADGEFTVVEPPHRAAYTWRGAAAPGATAVDWTMEPVEGGVQIDLVHSGFGAGAEWDGVLAEADKGWSDAVANLRSTLETGADLRITCRPFLGITFDLLNAERAAKEGIAVDEGIYLTDTVEGGGARAAGLTRGDVIVAIAGLATSGYDRLVAALNARRAGDVVSIEIVRGQNRVTVPATLGKRPQYEVPPTAAELGERLAASYRESDAALRAALVGATNAQACPRPAEGEWSVLEVLAHLSIVERDYQCYLGAFAVDGWLDTGAGNASILPGRIACVLEAAPSLEAMLARFLADEAETVGFVSRLPEETVAHKARFWRIAQTMLGLPGHTHEHTEQIKAALAAARA